MKTYNRPITQVTYCSASYMLMQNISGGGLQGIHSGQTTDPIVIN